MHTNPPYLSAMVAAAGLVGGAYCAYHIYQHANRKRFPENWIQVGTLKDIYIFPVKSCGPVKLQEAECTALGLRDSFLRDRIFMIVDSKMNFISARQYHDLVLIQPTVEGSVLTLRYKDMQPISVNIDKALTSKSRLCKATVWGTTVPVYDCGADVGEWFSKILSVDGLRVVYYASDKGRKLELSEAYSRLFNYTKYDRGGLTDDAPFNLINGASIDDLNSRLESIVSPLQFRPNFVVDGAKPFDEDNWRFVKIGKSVFEMVQPCVRCVLTTIDPETGIRNSKAEPLITLRSYRLPEDPEVRKATGTAPRMGLQMAMRTPPGAAIKVNDPVYIPC